MVFRCTCDKVFSHASSFSRHRKSHNTRFCCNICRKTFTRHDSLMRHQKQEHEKTERRYKCGSCNKEFKRRDNMLQHQRTHRKEIHAMPSTSRKRRRFPPAAGTGPTAKQRHVQPGGANGFAFEEHPMDVSENQITQTKRLHKCSCCDKKFKRRDNMLQHQRTHRKDVHALPSTFRKKTRDPPADVVTGPTAKRRHVQPGGANGFAFEEDPMDVSENLIPQHDDIDVKILYQQKWSTIRTQFRRTHRVQDTYNFRLDSKDPNDLNDKVWAIFRDQQTVFKINLSFGFFLRDGETGTLQYFSPSENTNQFLEEPVLVDDEVGLCRFLDKIGDVDVMEQACQQRPNSKSVVHRIVNLTFYVYKLKEHPIGAPGTVQDYISKSRSIISLRSGPNGPYTDNLCFFRCLALHQHCKRTKLERTTKSLFKKYLVAVGKTAKQFKGVSLKQLNDLEVLFEVNMYVYALEPNDDNNDYFAKLVRRPNTQYKNTMYLNLCGEHFSYIKDIKTYAKSYACPQCGKRWRHRGHYQKHIDVCDGKVACVYPGGAYHLPQTIFEKLQDEGIFVPKEDRYYPYRACFDIECLIKPLEKDNESSKLQWELLSVSVASNVPGFEVPKCFVSNGDPTEVAETFRDYLLQISHKAKTLLSAKFAWVIEKMESIRESGTRGARRWRRVNGKLQTAQAAKKIPRKRHYMTNLLTEFEKYLSQLVVLSFNGRKYHLNAMKKVFLPLLLKSTSRVRPIKKNNYMSIETERLKFLDLTNYVAPGFSYYNLLKAYKCQETKGFFPYEWMDSLDKLNHTQLPPQDAFYSKLCQSGISKEDYRYCQQIWGEHGMTTMRDFLIWYNNKDVGSMVEAVQEMFKFYKEKAIDMFKDGSSVPDLTMKYLFMNLPSSTYFTLMNNEDEYRLFKDNIVGGPSIIFHRYHEKDKTYIRADEMKKMGKEPKLCKKVVGLDANALYLWALMQDMPTGHYIQRRKDKGFKREYSDPSLKRMAVEWLEWEAEERGIVIWDKFKKTEKLIGPCRIPVDGFCSETREIFQFHGCYWHGHKCQRGIMNKRRGKPMATLLAETAETTKYLKSCGYKVHEMWECMWKEKRASAPLSSFLAKRKTPTEHHPYMTSEGILQAVRSNEMFGAVECDIEVPASLESHFAEMPPIFKNVDISIKDIGEYMKAYAEEHHIMSKPRRSLIGSMFGQKVLLATPLLNWYLDHGLKVTRIYQVIEYRPKPCFKPFGDAVSNAQRAGDEDEAKKIIADTMKLIGNSAYDKMVTNKEKETDIEYCQDVVTATQKINTSQFRHMVIIKDKILFQVESSKRKIRFDLPLQIGFFVYQYRKLRMLQFYYDFMRMYVDMSDFQYCAMDTDSAYMAISANSLEKVIKPDMLAMYNQKKSEWFPRTDTQQNKAYDKHTPGLFKEEWSGNGIVALCSKTYYCYGADEKCADKLSCKGLNKRCNDINYHKFLNVLQANKSSQGINRGFCMRSSKMHTYTQTLDALPYFYPKRKVKNDGITTDPLDI